MHTRQTPYQCPLCSRTRSFSHPDTTLLVCTCGAVLHRLEGGIVVSKPFAVIRDPVELIGPGTAGSFEGKNFQVLGRFRAWCDVAVINYWTILLDDQELAWLAEGYGLYAVYRPCAPISSLSGNRLKSMKPAGTAAIDQETFFLQKISSCSRWEVQGELHFPASPPSFKIWELSAPSGNQKAVFELLDGYSLYFTVSPVSFSALNLSPLNEDAYPGKEIVCRMCSGLFTVKTYPFAQTYSCPLCDACYGYAKGEWTCLTKQRGPEIKPGIRLHTTGTVNGVLYEVIGYTLKKENNEEGSAWREYTLFNAGEGFAFLSEFRGHWMFAREQQPSPVLKGGHTTSFTYHSEPFSLFNHYTYEAFNIRGEFPYNVLLAADTQADEFISPPEMWIREASTREGIAWYRGEHISSNIIADNFSLAAGLPPQSGVGAVQPTGFINPYKLAFVTAIGIAGFIVCFLLAGLLHANRVIIDKTYTFKNDSVQTVSVVTEKFYLDRWKSNLELDVSAPVQNSWFELAATLVDAQTGTEYATEKGVEYYSGNSGGESWSEGSTSETAHLNGIPAGQYYLQIQGTREPGAAGKAGEFRVRAVYDVLVYRNLFIGMLLILIWPVVQFVKSSINEKRRWYNSPYSPYTYED